jgi:soluble lytic murein transglycosylase-like protein
MGNRRNKFKAGKRWDIAAWSFCMLSGVLLMLSQLAMAGDAGRVSDGIARDAVDSALDETVAPVPQAKPSVEEASGFLIDAIIQVESAGNPRRVGREGERGLMQLKPRTWATVTHDMYGRKLSFDRAFDPSVNRKVGRAYLAVLHTYLLQNKAKWKADERSLLLACYNAGPRAVRRSGFSLKTLPASTRDYVKRASALHDEMMREAREQLASL